MATQFNNALVMTNGTDAQFRAWVQFIDDLFLLTGGWVNTADTGQMTISTALHPTVASQKVGYRIYRMNDALQATSPVFVKISYGSNSLGANNPGIWVTIGRGSDGAGNITDIRLAETALWSLGSSIAASNSYGSADSSRIHWMMFVRSAATDNFTFSLERAKNTDGSGNDVGDGLYFIYPFSASTAGSIQRSQYVNLLAGGQPPSEFGVSLILSNQSVSSFSANTGVGLPVCFKGVAQPPGLGFVAVNDGDYLAEAQFTMSLYGATRTYQLGNSNSTQIMVPTGNGGATTRNNTRIGIRFD